MTGLATILAAFLLAVGDGPGSQEVEARRESVRKALADESRPLDDRASMALEEASALDREAQSSPTVESRRERAAEAIKLLDDFNAEHPRHPLETPLALQAAVFTWADGRRDLEAWRLARSDGAKKDRAIGRLDEALGRLEKLEPALSGADPLVAQNARFRLAQAQADRAGLDSDGRDRLKKSLAAIDPIPTESAVEVHARLLRAEVLARLGDLERAEGELDAAAKLTPPPPAMMMAEIRTRILLGQRRYGEAIRAIDAAGLDPVERDALGLQVRLAQRTDSLSGVERIDVETDALRRARSLRGSSSIEARRALNDLARALDGPPPHAEPEAWDLLGEAAARGSATPPAPAGSSPRGPSGPGLWGIPRSPPGSCSAPGRSSSRPATTRGPTPCSAGHGTSPGPAPPGPRPACSAPWPEAGPSPSVGRARPAPAT